MEIKLIQTIADGLEEIDTFGGGYSAEAADFLIDYLSERGYEFKDVIPEKAAKHET